MLFESDRLLIRPWQPRQDAPQALAIYGDPEVMRFIGQGKTQPNVEAMRKTLQKRLDLHASLNNGTGTWAVVERETSQIIGAILLVQLPDNTGKLTRDCEIGWHFRRSSWGQGYATEAATAIIEYGFRTLQLPVLYAIVNPKNMRSVRVTQRLGMTPLGLTNQYYGVEALLFQLTAAVKSNS